MSELFNTAQLLAERARLAPERIALVEPDGARAWRRITYRDLQREVELDASAFARAGLRRGDRVCVFVRPGIEWASIVFALFHIGALPVLIDPAMGRAGLLSCVERIGPRGFVGIPLAAAIKLACPRSFASVEVSIVVGALPIGGRTLAGLRKNGHDDTPLAPTTLHDDAAVLFTSGSTGPAKGVVYTHGMFRAQVAALRELYDMREGDVDLACFAPFALFGPTLGLTTVLPRIDFSRPAQADPAEIVRAIREHGAVQTFGSPAIWRRVAPWARQRGITLPSLKRLMIAGAPVHPPLIESCLAMLPPDGDLHTPYGATEALPVASASGREILARHRGATESGSGNNVGRLAPFIEARVIKVSDEIFETWDDSLEVERGQPGELIVRGPQVTRAYELEPEHTRKSKIRDGDSVWHRMGDVVRIDVDANIWFLGRKSHRLETASGPLYPVGLENIFNVHPAVRRSALVGVGARGAERPVLIVELEDGSHGSDALAREILARGEANEHARVVEKVLFRSHFPVDVRHNAKIDRGALKQWAQEALE